MGIKVTKFGGSSLANAEQFKKVIDILKADPQRRYAVPSAPGKRFSGDDKITDLLYKCHDIATAGKSIDQVFDIIRSRYINIAQDLGLDYSPEEELEQIRRNIQKGERRDYVASRGEYLNGLILAHALKWDFIDAADVIFMIMCCCGTFGVVVKTGAFHAGIGTILRKLGGKEVLLILSLIHI